VIIKFLKWTIEIKINALNNDCDLNSRILEILKFANEELSIPRLCEILDMRDDYIIASAVANLEARGDVILSELKNIYVEDEESISLQLYSIPSSVQH